jgi:hypothetical protein
VIVRGPLRAPKPARVWNAAPTVASAYVTEFKDTRRDILASRPGLSIYSNVNGSWFIATSCNTAEERLQRWISGASKSMSLSKASLVNNRKHSPSRC